MPEISKNQRHARWLVLEKIFKERILKGRGRRDRTVREAVEAFGYTQPAMADHLGIRFACGEQKFRRPIDVV